LEAEGYEGGFELGSISSGAGDGTRTHGPLLGKHPALNAVALIPVGRAKGVQLSSLRRFREWQVIKCQPHRHTAATRMLANGADLHTVQRMLRHADIRTTLRYLHLVPEQLQEKMRLFSPLTGIAEPRRRMVPT